MSAIFIFGVAVRDLSVALTELRVAIRLCDGVVVGTRIAPCPHTQINIISTAAMHIPLPRWVLAV